MKRFCLLLLLMFACLAPAQDLPLEIKGKGVKVIVTAEKPTPEYPIILRADKGFKLYIWQDSLRNSEIGISEVKIYADAPLGELTVKCVAIDKDFNIRNYSATLQIGGLAPPVVPPGPSPGPPVVETLGFVTLAKTELAKLPAEVRGLAPALADNFEAVASKLAATASMTVDQANADLKARHQTTLGANRSTWLPWFAAWKIKADELNATGQLATREHYVTAYQETATGLRK